MSKIYLITKFWVDFFFFFFSLSFFRQVGLYPLWLTMFYITHDAIRLLADGGAKGY